MVVNGESGGRLQRKLEWWSLKEKWGLWSLTEKVQHSSSFKVHDRSC